jgi:hypothetical protein
MATRNSLALVPEIPCSAENWGGNGIDDGKNSNTVVDTSALHYVESKHQSGVEYKMLMAEVKE